ncbi:MAG TPA: molybdopterin-guanine dinucleotide biosynthesis protein B [Alphaproteobacteria bacterium]|nr:molybdopterin-guanine dinucleotide biosynthesis protein B [Alphaproteobacteria bacterium]
MKIFGLAGWSGSGKTTLMVRLLPALIARGVSVSTMKHAHHAFDIDRPGKDSYEHRAAGATEVMISSNARWALMHELRGGPEATVEQLIKHMTPVDLLMIEGFKSHAHPKLEVHRAALGKPLLCADDPHVVAIASDVPIPSVRLPRFALDDAEGIADFIIGHCGLARPRVASAG